MLAPLVALLVASIAGCATATTSGNGNDSAATATGSRPTACDQVAGFMQAGPLPQAGAMLGSIPFPAHSVFTSLNQVAGGGPGLYSIQLMHVCTSGITAEGIRSYFASQVAGFGWKQSATYPYDGGYQAPCGDPYCWSRVPSLPTFLSLEKVTDVGNGLVTYGIRLAIPPSPPDCSGIAPPGGGTPMLEFFWSQQPNVPVPPLTAEGLYDGHDVGGKTVLSQSMCSPGTAASVQTFMSIELSKVGFVASVSPYCGSTGWFIKNNLAVAWHAASPADWTLSYCR